MSEHNAASEISEYETGILKERFPVIKNEGKRYNKDDIIKVLNFMKENNTVNIVNIAKYSNISLGTLVSWRKKYGANMGIKTKSYGNLDVMSPDILAANSTSSTSDSSNSHSEHKAISTPKESVSISLSMIQELQRHYKVSGKAEMSLNGTLFIVDDQYLRIQLQNK